MATKSHSTAYSSNGKAIWGNISDTRPRNLRIIADHGGQYGDIRWSNQSRAGVSAKLAQSAAVLQEGPEALFLGVAAAAAETQCNVTDRPNFALNCLGINTIDPIDLSSDAEKRPLYACDTGVSKLESRLRSTCVGDPALHRHHNDGVRTESVFPGFKLT